ncbi:MAG: Maf family nucleotide pyrophosphatase [Flavobacteriaceae bacterium]|tara:strand:- start:1442 stop:2023 length:582 start_codon:yes stop_codon:yes gene_type:complete
MAFEKLNKDKKIILSSNSPRRKQLLQEAGLKFEIRTFPTNEDYPVNLKGREISEFLVKKKAIPFNKIKKDEIIITADTIVWVQNEHLGKPKDTLEAKSFLEKISNKEHEVITSVCFSEKEKQTIISESTFVFFKRISSNEINYYLKNFSFLDKAGGYGIQDWIGIIGVKKIVGSYTNVIGLPVSQVLETIQKL